jgi:hypothetical protein
MLMTVEELIKLGAAVAATATATAAAVQGFNTGEQVTRDKVLEKVIIAYASDNLELETQLEECQEGHNGE